MTIKCTHEFREVSAKRQQCDEGLKLVGTNTTQVDRLVEDYSGSRTKVSRGCGETCDPITGEE
jgi:hypothetical protein